MHGVKAFLDTYRGRNAIAWVLFAVFVIVLACHSRVSCAADFELGEYTLDEKQLKQAVYGRGFNIGLNEDSIDKLMEIQQHLQAGHWVKAFRLIDANRQLWTGKQVPRADGFTLPVDEFLARLVASLPAEARDSFDTYFSARANQLLNQAAELPPEDEVAELRRLQSYYALTPAGSESANRLGDAYFERGRFRQAASVWAALVRDHSLDLDTERRVYAKIALAHARVGNQDELNNTLELLEQRFKDVECMSGQRRCRLPISSLVLKLSGATAKRIRH
jgi:tetratricopeptide (TPR) repeat protein